MTQTLRASSDRLSRQWTRSARYGRVCGRSETAHYMLARSRPRALLSRRCCCMICSPLPPFFLRLVMTEEQINCAEYLLPITIHCKGSARCGCIVSSANNMILVLSPPGFTEDFLFPEYSDVNLQSLSSVTCKMIRWGKFFTPFFLLAKKTPGVHKAYQLIEGFQASPLRLEATPSRNVASNNRTVLSLEPVRFQIGALFSKAGYIMRAKVRVAVDKIYYISIIL